jgi:hypothetical protein
MDICLFLSTQPGDVESGLIRRFTLCDWSHCGFYRIQDGSTFSAMHDSAGVAWRPKNPEAKILLLSAPKMDEAFAWALEKAGTPATMWGKFLASCSISHGPLGGNIFAAG